MTDWLVDTLIWTSALMLVVLAIREPVRRQFGAGVAYALWAIPAARILMPTLTHTVERAAPAPAALPASDQLAPAAFAQTPYLASATEVAAAQPSLVEQLGGWPVILLFAWLSGAGVLFVNRMWAYAKERRRILADAVTIGQSGRVRIVRSDAVEGPLAFGIFSPVIAVPETFRDHFTPSERRLALEHELAHHRSGDLVANFIAFVLLSLQWFNPLAWASYAAFRFDQEAACDARVLDRADDPAAYGRAIAKAASGRALMFASALDKKSTLKRRLKSMINTTTKGRRRLGNMMVLGCVAVALPLTATKAVEYVEREPTAPTAPKAPAAPSVPTAPVAPTAPSAPLAPSAPAAPVALATTVAFQDNGKPYSQMTAEERAEFDAGIAELREALDELQSERGEVRVEIREAMAEARIDKEEMRAELAEAQREIEEAMAELKAEREEMIAEGVDPAVVEASLKAAMASLEAMDLEAIMESAMSAIDEEAIQAQVEASLAVAEQSIRQSLAEMEERRRQ